MQSCTVLLQDAAEIERGTGSGGTWNQIATVGAVGTSYSNTGLSAATRQRPEPRRDVAPASRVCYSPDRMTAKGTPGPHSPRDRARRIVGALDACLIALAKEHVLKDPGARDADARRALAGYLTPDPRPARLEGRDGVYHHLAATAQEYGMAPTVVGRAIGGVASLEPVLFGFDPARVRDAYPSPGDWEALLDRIVAELSPRGKLRREPRSVWPRYCRSLITGAHFLARFGTAKRFYTWAEGIERDPARRAELPMLLTSEVEGFGFALSCAFLMELGSENYLKPDVWVIRFCGRLGIRESADPAVVFAACAELAGLAGVTPFALDRMIWLVGTGDFWLHGAKAGSQLERFLTSLGA